MNSTKVYPGVAREIRRSTSNATGNDTKDSLGVVVRRVGLLLNKPEGYVQPVFDTFHQIGIRSCDALDAALSRTLNNTEDADRITIRFEGASDGLCLRFRQMQYL